MSIRDCTNSFIGEFHLEVSGSPSYSLMHKPLVGFGHCGSECGEFLRTRGVTFRHETQEIFIIDQDNSRIQIFDVHGKYIYSFGQQELFRPAYLVIHEEFLFVTDWGWLGYSLFKFDITSLRLLKRTGKNGYNPKFDYNLLRQPFIGPKDTLYIPDNNNNRICVFSMNLKQTQVIQYENSINPLDVAFHNGFIYILSNSASHCLFQCDLFGNILSSFITRGEVDNQTYVKHPSSFIIDCKSNIIISDLTDHCIKVFDPLGKNILRKIGGQGNEFGRLYYPKSIILTKKGNLIVTSLNELYAIQIF